MNTAWPLRQRRKSLCVAEAFCPAAHYCSADPPCMGQGPATFYLSVSRAHPVTGTLAARPARLSAPAHPRVLPTQRKAREKVSARQESLRGRKEHPHYQSRSSGGSKGTVKVSCNKVQGSGRRLGEAPSHRSSKGQWAQELGREGRSLAGGNEGPGSAARAPCSRASGVLAPVLLTRAPEPRPVPVRRGSRGGGFRGFPRDLQAKE